MRTTLSRLKPGTQFRVPEIEIEATLVSVNDCRARVRIDRGEKRVTFCQPDGSVREFTARQVRTVSWSCQTLVHVVESQG